MIPSLLTPVRRRRRGRISHLTEVGLHVIPSDLHDLYSTVCKSRERPLSKEDTPFKNYYQAVTSNCTNQNAPHYYYVLYSTSIPSPESLQSLLASSPNHQR